MPIKRHILHPFIPASTSTIQTLIIARTGKGTEPRVPLRLPEVDTETQGKCLSVFKTLNLLQDLGISFPGYAQEEKQNVEVHIMIYILTVFKGVNF